MAQWAAETSWVVGVNYSTVCVSKRYPIFQKFIHKAFSKGPPYLHGLMRQAGTNHPITAGTLQTFTDLGTLHSHHKIDREGARPNCSKLLDADCSEDL